MNKYKGIVYDQTTNTPTPGVKIISSDNNILSITDGNGGYLFEGNETSITFSKPGYINFTFNGQWIIDNNGNVTSPNNFYIEPFIKPSTEEIEKQREKDKNIRNSKLESSNILSPNQNNIDKATSQNQKPTGESSLQKRVLTQSKILLITILPAITALAISSGISSINLPSPILPDKCPNNDELSELINKRNNIVGMLNKVASNLNITTAALTGISITYSVISNILTTTNTILPITEIGLSLSPTTPGASVVALSKLKDIIINSKSKLDKYKSIIDSTSLSLSLISITILLIITLLKSLDLFFNKCKVNPPLTEINSNLLLIAEQQSKSSQTIEQIGYKGFTIKIDTIPYNSTINRKKAVGINSSGIKLIETELSFTENESTLIQQLKNQIDKENLKAN